MLSITLYHPEGSPGRGVMETVQAAPGMVPPIGSRISTSRGTFRVAEVHYATEDGSLSNHIAIDLADTED